MDRRKLAGLALIAAALAPAVAVAASDGEKKKKTGGLSYIPLDPITATAIRPDGRRGVLTVETGIDVPSVPLHDKAEKLIPRIRAAFVQTVQIYAAGLTPGLPPNVDFLKRELQRQTDLSLGGPGGRLLLGTVMVN
jgi:hypothetical protein